MFSKSPFHAPLMTNSIIILSTLLFPMNSSLGVDIPLNTWINLEPNADLTAKPNTGNWNGKPAGRAWFPMVYHPIEKKVLLFGGGVGGGCNVGYINDVWEYDFPMNSWKQRRTPDPYLSWPSGMDNQVMAYDSINNVMWIFGGTCGGGFGYYDYAKNTFVRVSKPNAHHEGTYDPGFAFGEGKIVVFSGEPAWYYNPGERTSVFDVIAQTWIDAKSTKSPPPRQQIENVMVYDTFQKKFVIFSGENHAGSLFSDTWEYDLSKNTWTETTPAISPPARKYHTMVYDSKHRVVIMHGGKGGASGDTWVYDVGTKIWKQIATDGPKLYLHGMAYDAANDVVILFGGADENGSSRNATFGFRYAPANSDVTPPAPPLNLNIKEGI